MSRFRRVIHSVASGYFVIGTTAVYSLASVPLALKYLSKADFALWALMSSISGYLALIDLGMSGSVARLLIDYKDKRADGVYGSLIKTGWCVLVTQGVFIWMIGFGFAPVLASLLDIPSEVREGFVTLMRWQSSLLALSFASKIFGHLLTAHQRMDLINYGQVAGIVVGYFSLWFFFSHGHGVYSWILASFVTLFTNVICTLPACFKMNVFPPAGQWGRARWYYFRELFGYGKDLFLVAVGTQMIVASQTMIITRTLGLEAAAAWSVGTKMFNLLTQLIYRIFDVSCPALSEMQSRNETSLLQARYKAIVILSASFSALVAVIYVVCNSSFVTVWSHGKFIWPTTNDLLLASWMVVMAVLHCHNCFVLVLKDVRFMRYIYFIEGIVFVATSLFLAKHWGLPAIIGCSVVCSALLSGAYGIRRVSEYFQLPVREVALRWMYPMLKVLALFVPIAAITYWSLQNASPEWRLVSGCLICAPLGMYLFLRFGISDNFQKELMARAPKQINPFLRRVFVVGSP